MNIPAQTLLGFLGAICLLVGGLLILTGFGVVEIEQYLRIVPGIKTWGAGIILIGIGDLLLGPELGSSAPEPEPTIMPADMAAAIPTATAADTPTPVVSEAAATPPPATNTAQAVSTSTETPVPATPSPVPTLTGEEFLRQEAGQWPSIFIDDFNDNQGDWRPIDGAVTPGVTLSFDGRFNVSIQTGDDSIIEMFYREAETTRDTYLLTVNAAALDEDACEYGLVFKGDINRQYYVFSIRGNERRYSIDRVAQTDPRRQELASGNFPESVDLPNTLTVIVEGSYYRFYINDTFVAELTDEKLSGNRVGIQTFLCPNRSVNFVFDKFELREPAP